MTVIAVVLREGMEIGEQELLDRGCRFTTNFALDSKVFEKDDQFIYWSAKTRTIWCILHKSK